VREQPETGRLMEGLEVSTRGVMMGKDRKQRRCLTSAVKGHVVGLNWQDAHRLRFGEKKRTYGVSSVAANMYIVIQGIYLIYE
jgi:hypothetical protein